MSEPRKILALPNWTAPLSIGDSIVNHLLARRLDRTAWLLFVFEFATTRACLGGAVFTTRTRPDHDSSPPAELVSVGRC